MAIPSITGGKIATEYDAAGGLVSKANTFAADRTDGWSDALAPKASDIFETRTATRIFNSHQEIAVKNIEGSREPTFSENENLYGFTIFQFKRGFLGGGWAPINVNSLLGFDLGSVGAGMLGGDQVANVNSYFFNLHPKAITMTEPFATQLVPTQGGGVYAESQGSILKTLTLNGTTGYRPAMTHTPSNSLDNVIPWEVNEPTGYLNFLKLRNVFRNYSDLKKSKSQAYKTYMIWFNNKEQEAWFFEPSNFATSRDAASPFTYTYTISGTLIQKVNFSSVVNTIHPDPSSPHFLIANMRRAAGMINGIVGLVAPSWGDNVVGEMLGAGGRWLGILDDIDRTVMNAITLGTGVAGLVPLVVGTAGALCADFKSKINNVKSKYGTLFGTSVEDSFDAWGKFLTLDNALNDSYASAIKLIQPEILEQLESSASNPIVNSSVSSDKIVHPNVPPISEDEGLIGVEIDDPDKSLEEYVYEATGDTSKTQQVAEMNGLTYPYISAAPTYQGGLNKFLTMGDILYIPVDKDFVSGDNNVKINSQKLSGNFYEEILGRDLKLTKNTHATTGVSEFNLAIDPNGDLALVAGKPNMEQAIDIKLNTERGELTPHPEFGIVPVVGHKGTYNINFNLYLSLNDTMLSDGRIKELIDTYVKISGDIVSVKTKINRD